jgi:hydrogen cyanide synthase HcnB
MKEAELVIIGGGPAGIKAATEAARIGASVALIDENRSLGGKVFDHTGHGPRGSVSDKMENTIKTQLLKDFKQVGAQIAVYLDAEIWNIVDQRIVLLCSKVNPDRKVKSIKGKKLIICAGAYERAIPVPGWTLPGVFTVGGLNTLVKREVLPGENFLLAGSGPLLLVLANNLINAGARLSAIVDATSLGDIMANAFQLFTNINYLRIRSGFEYLYNIRKHHIPIYRSHVLSRVHGTREVEKAQIVRVDESWKPLKGSEKKIRVDTIAYGFGMIPCTELTRLCGCSHIYDEKLGYWQVELNPRMETTVPGIFVAGDGLTIKGYSAAIEEGRVAAIEACTQLAYVNRREADRLLHSSLRKLKRFKRFGQIMDAISTPRPGILEILSEDTIVCRCEEVTVRDVILAVAAGARDVNDIKRRTRLGMGHCQGRFCGQVINELLWRLTNVRTQRDVFTARIPAKPISFGSLAG